MKYFMLSILVLALNFKAFSEVYVCWYMYADQMAKIDDIKLYIYDGDLVKNIVSIDKSEADNLWLHNKNPLAFNTIINFDLTDLATYSFQFEMLHEDNGWEHTQIYSYSQIKNYIHNTKPSWIDEHVVLNRNYLHVNGLVPGAIPEPSTNILLLIGLCVLGIKRKNKV